MYFLPNTNVRSFLSTRAEDWNQIQCKSLLTKKYKENHLEPLSGNSLGPRRSYSKSFSQLLACCHPNVTKHAQGNFLWKLSKETKKKCWTENGNVGTYPHFTFSAEITLWSSSGERMLTSKPIRSLWEQPGDEGTDFALKFSDSALWELNKRALMCHFGYAWDFIRSGRKRKGGETRPGLAQLFQRSHRPEGC